MKLISGLLDKYFHNFKFRTKLIISYIMLITTPMVLLGYVFYTASTDVVSQSAKESIYQLVRKSVENLDIRLEKIVEGITYIHIDNELYDFFGGMDPENTYNRFNIDERITRILSKYFTDSSNIYSVHLITSYGTFGNTNAGFIPPQGFKDSKLYRYGLDAKDKISWVPTFGLWELFNEEDGFYKNLEGNYIFSAAKLINISKIDANSLRPLADHVERPVLIVNLRQDMLVNIFEECAVAKGSFFQIFDNNGITVSHSDLEKIGKPVDQQLLQAVRRHENGVSYMNFNGQRFLICFDKSVVTDWNVAVALPHEEVVSKLLTICYYIVYTGLLLIGLMIMLSYAISARITRPINELLAGIKKIGEGCFSVNVKVKGDDEIGHLVKKFNEMDDKIRNLIKQNYEIKLSEKEAEIMALNLQFNPHFIYNTLNTINWIALENNQEKISKMISSLSLMLQYTVKEAGKLLKLKLDIQYLENYLYIMKSRFEDTFEVFFDIDPLLYDTEVPRFFLQPFVENALVHGFENIQKIGLICISGYIRDQKRYFFIEDNGCGISPQKLEEIITPESNSIGIKNVNNKINLLFGCEYGVHLESDPGRGTKVTIILPL